MDLSPNLPSGLSGQKPEIRARCGSLCSSCAAYKENAKTDDDCRRASEGWQKVLGFLIPPEGICCDGCLEPDENNPRRIEKDCRIRACVLEKKIVHCGKCSTFPCEHLEQHLRPVEHVGRDEHKRLSDKEVREFVEPYLCREFLEASARKQDPDPGRSLP
ncbi:DUF3795 domain-containing protein [Methanosphaerula palustris]|uniref:DUF3795 domain-containing protein n=1 Tax=Methanosphaerula palustris (strain ATCC BAA-1556 / DSM 19958 / E1-9c) TaxID=521011 RepID=B8GIJ1_METPE|nr:DUF3795 domain-containing protein [Methanosphaerula palustris]ACL16804.1 hypothetical protein Mpal_1483 [Methanosphaerula palustris E1-9c]